MYNKRKLLYCNGDADLLCQIVGNDVSSSPYLRISSSIHTALRNDQISNGHDDSLTKVGPYSNAHVL